MIAVIMAAGKGSRLGNYTTDLPKSLLPLKKDNSTLLDYNLQILNKIGIERIIIVTGFNSEQIEKHTANDLRVEIVYNPYWDCCNVLGSLYMALDVIKDDFLFLHADTLADLEIWKMLLDFNGAMVLPYENKKCGEEEMKIKLDSGNKLLLISKEIDPQEAEGEFLGIAKFNKKTIPFFKSTAQKLFKNGRLDYYMESVVQAAVEQEPFDINVMDILENKFVEVDFEEDYQRAKVLFGN